MNIPQKPSKPFWEQPESRRLEFKERFPKGDQIAKTVVAFANGAGGSIVFGVSNDPRQIVGFPDDELFTLEERISNHIFDQCAPTIIPEVYIQAVEGRNLLSRWTKLNCTAESAKPAEGIQRIPGHALERGFSLRSLRTLR